MAQLQITLDADQLKDLFADDDPMRALLEHALNDVLEAQITEQVGAGRYERTGAGSGPLPADVRSVLLE